LMESAKSGEPPGNAAMIFAPGTEYSALESLSSFANAATCEVSSPMSPIFNSFIDV